MNIGFFFDKENFLADLNEKCVPFMREFLDTQIFACFIQERTVLKDGGDVFESLLIEKMRRKAVRLTYLRDRPHKGELFKLKLGSVRPGLSLDNGFTSPFWLRRRFELIGQVRMEEGARLHNIRNEVLTFA